MRPRRWIRVTTTAKVLLAAVLIASETSTRQNGGNRRLETMMVNALDYYGTWKLFDALCDAAFYGKNREYALGNTQQQRYMGVWSDGVPVKELKVTDNVLFCG